MKTFTKLAQIYQEMEDAYDKIAALLDFGCTGCSDNCCDSYFMHHTYLEWAYLMEGFKGLPPEKRKTILAKAKDYYTKSQEYLVKGELPAMMCPLNEKGRCSLYTHRLMICRLHGVPTSLTLPNGQKKSFPGCFRCQELTAGRGELPTMDRTKFFREMVALEQELLSQQNQVLPKIKMTIAEMLIKGAPF